MFLSALFLLVAACSALEPFPDQTHPPIVPQFEYKETHEACDGPSSMKMPKNSLDECKKQCSLEENTCSGVMSQETKCWLLLEPTNCKKKQLPEGLIYYERVEVSEAMTTMEQHKKTGETTEMMEHTTGHMEVNTDHEEIITEKHEDHRTTDGNVHEETKNPFEEHGMTHEPEVHHETIW